MSNWVKSLFQIEDSIKEVRTYSIVHSTGNVNTTEHYYIRVNYVDGSDYIYEESCGVDYSLKRKAIFKTYERAEEIIKRLSKVEHIKVVTNYSKKGELLF